MNELLEESGAIVEQAITDIKPVATIAMISGGNDSMLAHQVAKALGIRIDFIMHGRTGTGIEETTDFVRQFATNDGVPYIEADAGTAYEDYVMRRGFFGRGRRAHEFAYHTLKQKPFAKAISKHIRQGKAGRPVVLLNGARIEESTNRANNMTTPVRANGANHWVNICHYWTKAQRDDFLSDCKAPVNPVTKELCRSGECLCGTAQDAGTRLEAAALYPHWGKWLDDLESRVTEKFPWGWGDDIPKSFTLEKAGQMRMFETFTPMCVSCNTSEATP